VYTTCLFCTRPLGANEVLESFPVGRRIAFDAAKGRLWVVCPRCERWNLTPLEERWEAIEQAEGLYRATRQRVSTDQIGLARVPGGLELVRVGKPERPEMAAWRYGDQFGRRRRKRLITAGLVVTGGVLVVAGSATAGLGIAGLINLGRTAASWAQHGFPGRTVARIRPKYGPVLRVRRANLSKTRLVPGPNGELALDLRHTYGRVRLEGAEARHAAALLFPAVNQFGGTKDDVQRAVGRLEHAGGADEYLARIVRSGEKLMPPPPRTGDDDDDDDSGAGEQESGLVALPISVRLAIEMALHEEQERRALEGELAELEAAWRDAEEIGAIADSLLLPPWIEDAIKRMR